MWEVTKLALLTSLPIVKLLQLIFAFCKCTFHWWVLMKQLDNPRTSKKMSMFGSVLLLNCSSDIRSKRKTGENRFTKVYRLHHWAPLPVSATISVVAIIGSFQRCTTALWYVNSLCWHLVFLRSCFHFKRFVSEAQGAIGPGSVFSKQFRPLRAVSPWTGCRMVKANAQRFGLLYGLR